MQGIKCELDMGKSSSSSRSRSRSSSSSRVVEALETCQSSFDHELGASRHHNREDRRR